MSQRTNDMQESMILVADFFVGMKTILPCIVSVEKQVKCCQKTSNNHNRHCITSHCIQFVTTIHNNGCNRALVEGISVNVVVRMKQKRSRR